jgi:hypothetical protein
MSFLRPALYALTAFVSGGAAAAEITIIGEVPASSAAEAVTSITQKLDANSFTVSPEDPGVANQVLLMDVLENASGNTGTNAAAGAFNLQANSVVVAWIDAATLAQSSATIAQTVQGGMAVVHGLNEVTIDGALRNASGNHGVNAASGVGNVQLNSVTLARPETGSF